MLVEKKPNQTALDTRSDAVIQRCVDEHVERKANGAWARLTTRRKTSNVAWEWRRHELPYGAWTRECGELVLFNRKYLPIYRNGSGAWQPCLRTELRNGRMERNWIGDIVDQRWFYSDGDTANNQALTWRLEQLMREMMSYVPTREN